MSTQKFIVLVSAAITLCPLRGMELEEKRGGYADNGRYYRREAVTHFIERVRNYHVENALLSEGCESIAYFPQTNLVAMVCGKDSLRELIVKKMNKNREQKSYIPQHFVLPNKRNRLTIGFDKDGTRVLICEKLHKIETYSDGREIWRQLYQIVPVTVARAVDLDKMCDEERNVVENLEDTKTIHFIERVRNHHHKTVKNKYYSMIPFEMNSVATATTYDAWTLDKTILALLHCVHANSFNQEPLKNPLLIFIDTPTNEKIGEYFLSKKRYENIAFFSAANLVALIYRSKKNNDVRKLLIENLITRDRQKSYVRSDFVVPNVCERLTIGFNRKGTKVIIVEQLHNVKTYPDDSEKAKIFGLKEDWRQLYEIVPVTVGHSMETEQVGEASLPVISNENSEGSLEDGYKKISEESSEVNSYSSLDEASEESSPEQDFEIA